MGVIDTVTTQFRERLNGELQSIEVPEWAGEDGKPLKIYYKPLINFKAQGKILALFNQKKDEEAVCMSLIIRCLDGDGKHIFKTTDMQTLLHECDPDIVNRILAEMQTNIDDSETLKKT